MGTFAITTDDGTLQMEILATPIDATYKCVTWSVTDGTGSATIDANGLLTAIDNGTVTVTVTINDGSGVSGAVEITISNQVILVSSVTVQGQNGVSTIYTDGGTLQMEATVLPTNATDKSVTWSVTDGTGSATIDANGLLTATSNGTVTIKATANDASGVSGTGEITISNQVILVNSITVQGQNGVSSIYTDGGTLQIEATVLPTNATDKNVTWSVIDGTGSASIDANGLLTATATGIVIVKATANDGSMESGTTEVTIFNQSTVGLSSSALNDKFSIYPNPVSEQVVVESQGLEIESINIIDSKGNFIKEASLDGNIDVSELALGVYFLQIKSDENLIIKRFVKE
jgi:uncharacterized protein YjdB